MLLLLLPEKPIKLIKEKSNFNSADLYELMEILNYLLDYFFFKSIKNIGKIEKT